MAFRWNPELNPSEITPESLFKERRRFMQIAALTSAGVAMEMSGLAEALPLGPIGNKMELPDEKQTPFSEASGYTNFYELGSHKEEPTANAAQLKTEPWTVVVDGAVAKPAKLALEDLLRPHPLEERVYRLRCVEAWSMVIPWIGFPLAALLQRFEPLSAARYVQFETIHDPVMLPNQRARVLDWPYREGLRLDEAMNPLTLIAIGMYGRELPNQNGAPLRLVVPWKYGFKSIKSIVRITLTEQQPETSWNQKAPDEYGFYANVNPAVDHPRWSQRRERRIGEFLKRDTLLFNGYGEQVAPLYTGLDLRKNF